MEPLFAFDYETYYSKEYSVKELGNWHYTHHPEFDAYLLSVVGENYEWVGNPKDFDWSKFENATLLSHNAGFEEAVTRRLQDVTAIPVIKWANLYDTADLAAYLGYPRSLAEASAHMLKEVADKTMRDKAKGKHWSDMTPEVQELMKKYALNDSRMTRRLFMEFGYLWPEWEREISKQTRDMCSRGLPVDAEKVQKACLTLEKRIVNAKALIPWAKEKDAPVLSLPRAAAESRKHGVTPPKSFAKDSEDFNTWLEENSAKFPWARALGEYRSVNMLFKKLKTLQARVDDKGIFHYGLKYFGAHTGRDSGDSGFNVQNPSRVPMHGVDVRGCMITAPEGYTLGIADESAIEPRTLSLLAGDEEMVQLLREGYDPYEAQARSRGQYKDPRPLKDVDPMLRQFKKVEVLGCGYGAGPDKVKIIAKQQAGLDITQHEAEQIVADFRKRKFIPDLWKKLEAGIKKSAPGNFELILPSGRVITYREVKCFGSVSAVIPRVGKMMRVKTWGGSLTENLIQAVSRDIFMWHVVEVAKRGYDILLRAHDEIVVLLKENTAQKNLNEILDIMHTAPPWLPDFPAAAAGGLSKSYTKM